MLNVLACGEGRTGDAGKDRFNCDGLRLQDFIGNGVKLLADFVVQVYNETTSNAVEGMVDGALSVAAIIDCWWKSLWGDAIL
jgi:hypothetical protein